MCDLTCPNPACAETLAYLAALPSPPPDRTVVSLCAFCERPNALVVEEGHLLVRELEEGERQALLMDPSYQRIVFEKAMRR